MSGNEPATKAKTDRRVLRTRDTLGDALMELMQETTFDSITVQQVLDRAGVGRSTFYAHYRDKEDLLLSEVEDFFELLATLLTRRGASLQRVAPVDELFSHIVDGRRFYDAFAASGKVNDVIEMGRGIIARSIEKRLRMAEIAMETEELTAYAHGLSGSFFSLLDWWIRHGMRQTPKDMDAMFHRMVWNGLGARTG